MKKWVIVAVFIAVLALLLAPIIFYTPLTYETEKLSSNVWNLKVEFLFKKVLPLSSRIVVIQNPDSNELAVYNPIAHMIDYSNFGKVKYLIVGNGDHVSGIPDVVKEFYYNKENDNKQKPTMLVPPGFLSSINSILQKHNLSAPIQEIQDSNFIQDFPFLEWKKIEGFDMNEIVIFDKVSQLMVVTDSCVHADDVEYPGYPFFLIKLIGFYEEVYRMPGVKTTFVEHITDADSLRKSINEICKSWEISGIVMSHGKPFVDKYAELYWQSAWMQRAHQRENK